MPREMSEIAKAVERAAKDSPPVRDALMAAHLIAGAERIEGEEAIEALKSFQAAYERANGKPHEGAAEMLQEVADEKGCPGK